MPEGSLFTTIIADEQPLVSEGLATLCESFRGCRVLGHCSDGEQAWEMIARLNPDVALLQVNLPRVMAPELLRRTRNFGLPTKVLAISDRPERRTILDMLRTGGHGLLLKSATGRDLEDALRQVVEGGVYLSPSIDLAQEAPAAPAENPIESLSAREQQVFLLLVEGVRAKEIASRLQLSPKTVDTYRANLMRKLDIHDVAGLVKFAIVHRMTSVEVPAAMAAGVRL